MAVAVFGNVTLDVICRTIDDVPRYESIAFDHVNISPGGCGSNVAIGLGYLKVETMLICRIGEDDSAKLLQNTWQRFNIDLRYVEKVRDKTTAVSIGLIDHDAQPRFIHTPGANATLTSQCIDVHRLILDNVNIMHVAGYFVLPGLLDGKLRAKLKQARQAGITTCLDVVYSPRYWLPQKLWSCISEVDIFFCNQKEAFQLTGKDRIDAAIKKLRKFGANTIIIKLGADGCYLDHEGHTDIIPAPKVAAIDTTGAGDAFAAGFIAALSQQKDIRTSCKLGNMAGARMVTKPGAIGGWVEE
jgi:sugar/nucleoside kinase (ribokinase family)